MSSPYLDESLIDATNSENFTPLDVAIMRGNVKAAAELIELGADVNVRILIMNVTTELPRWYYGT